MKRRLRPMLPLLLLIGPALAGGCGDPDAATAPLLSAPSVSSGAVRSTVPDSLSMRESGVRSLSAASFQGLPIAAGQRASVTVSYVQTSRCEVVSVSGAIEQEVFPQGVGGCGRGGVESDGIGSSTVIGPAATDGELVFRITSDGSSIVTGGSGTYTVSIGDELGDDMDDVVLRVTISGALTCGPQPVERGETARCTFTAPEPFTVLYQRASGQGFVVEETPNASYPAGGSHVWEGPAIADSRVEVMVETSAGRTPYTAGLTVAPRDWPPFHLRAPVVTVGLRGRMQPYPANGALGNALPELATAEAGAWPVLRAGQGPNAGLAILETPLPDIDHSIYMHPGLYAGVTPGSPAAQWRQDQNGLGSGTCTQAVFGILTPEVERHEGVTMASNSHWGLTDDFYRTSGAEQRLEELFTSANDLSLRATAYSAFVALHNGAYRTAQTHFDSTDIPQIMASLGCGLDLNPSDR